MLHIMIYENTMRIQIIIISFLFLITSCRSEGKEKSIGMTTKYEAETSDFDYSSDYDRIQQIKEWYEEATELEKNPVDVKRAKFDDRDQGGSAAQQCKQLKLRNGFEILISKEDGHEYETNAKYYYKDENLFFAYVSGSNVEGRYQLRFYFSENGKVIRILEKSEENDGSFSDNREIRGERFMELSGQIDEMRTDTESLFYGC